MRRFSTALSGTRIQEICGGKIRGDEQRKFSCVAEFAQAEADCVIYLEQDKFLEEARSSLAGLIICHPDKAELLPERVLLLHPKPGLAMLKLTSWWQEASRPKPPPGIHPSAIVDPTAQVSPEAYIGPFCVLEAGCRVGAGAVIGANCYLAENCAVGEGSVLYPNVSIYADCEIGENCILHSGAVVGADGFGFRLEDGVQMKIPQVGNVVVGNDVEIGANSCIDCGTLASTTIGDGCKIDNLVQIGHNCRIGKHSILCAQVGLAGSTVIGDYVYLAGQVGVAGHLSIGDRAVVGAQSGVTRDLPADGLYWGTPAMEAKNQKQITVLQRKLPEIYSQLRWLMKTRTQNHD